MSMPFYVPPEQMMKDRADYARKGIARGRSLVAFSVSDGIVEAIRRKDKSKSYIAALQWHPEFHKAGSDTIDDEAVLNDFLAAVSAAKNQSKA